MEQTSLFLRSPSYIIGGIFDNSERKPFSFPLHKHDDHSEMLLICEGEGRFGIENQSYTVGKGTLLFYHCGVWHEENSTNHPFKAMYIGYRDLEMKGYPRNFFLDPSRTPVIHLEEQFQPIKQLFHDIITEFQQSGPEYQLLADHYLGVIMVRLSRLLHYNDHVGNSNRPSLTAVPKAKLYIEQYYDTPITLKTLAHFTYMNEYHFAHLFKDATGISPIQYLIQYRMEVAKHYLKSTAYSITVITELVGYRSETTFNNTFKKITGMTPGRFRSEAK